jgi:hypothetical protein
MRLGGLELRRRQIDLAAAGITRPGAGTPRGRYRSGDPKRIIRALPDLRQHAIAAARNQKTSVGLKCCRVG